ncbi:hypothetical protein D3C73_533940 [compost metagenome]
MNLMMIGHRLKLLIPLPVLVGMKKIVTISTQGGQNSTRIASLRLKRNILGQLQ